VTLPTPLLRCRRQLQANARRRLDSCGGPRQSRTRTRPTQQAAQISFPSKLVNSQKNASLYVDYLNGKFVAPNSPGSHGAVDFANNGASTTGSSAAQYGIRCVK
jgi:hypothetical protein